MNRTHFGFHAVLCTLGKPILFACALALLAGCAIEPARPTFYAPPDQQPAALASIIGARTTSGYTSDRTTYLAAVDGLPVENAKEDFAHAIQVAAGYRTLTVAHASDSLVATSEVTTELQAGRTYFLKAEPAAADAAKNNRGVELYDIWLEDSSTREVVGVKHLAKLNAITDNMPSSANNFSDSAANGAAGEFLVRLVGMVLEAVIEAALAPDSHGFGGGPVHSGKQPSRGGESTPPRQAPSPSPVVKNPMPGKSAPQGDAQPGKMKIMMPLK